MYGNLSFELLRLRMLENWVIRKILGCKKAEATGEWSSV
jgi:hypothetical protein